MAALRSDFGDERRMMADINVTPLVDVMLVLLIIFMVTAPMLTQGIDVNLPKATAHALSGSEERLVVTVDQASRIYVNKQPVEMSRLNGFLKSMLSGRRDRQVFFRADRVVPYGFVVQVMAEIKNSGADELGMVTEPLER
jgi:biopolymer transport protein TolR